MAEKRRRKSKGNAAVWAVLALLILALGGFGIGGFGGSLSSVAQVGEREITVQDYADAIRAEQARLQQQTGQSFTLQQMRLFGLDGAIMERLLAGAALEVEAERVGVSAGDATVAARIRETPAFGGVDGSFDRQGYDMALERAGLDAARYEARVRDDIGREVLQAAIAGGVAVPAAYTDRIAAWIGETRDATLARVTVDDLDGGVAEPTDADLRALYDADPERFQRPELRAITYAWVTPEMLAAETAPDEAALRALYDARIDRYRRPARVLAERLAFADAAEAEAARAAIEADAATFESYVEARGLTLDDVDQGEIAAADVPAPVADALFALDGPGIAGPVETPLGPALYRVNAVLDPTETPFEDVRDALAAQASLAAARARIDASREDVDDLLAGGATLEEVAGETDLTLGTIRWDPSDAGTGATDVGAYAEFRDAAAALQEGDFPELLGLSDGGLLALRLDEVVPPEVPPLDDIRAEVAAAWTAADTARRLAERAEALAATPRRDAAATPRLLTGLTRDAEIDGAPAVVIDRIFAAQAGDVVAVPGDEAAAYVFRLDAVNAADLSQGQAAALRTAIETQTRQEIASDVFEGYGRAVLERAGFTVDAQAVQAVQAQLGGAGG